MTKISRYEKGYDHSKPLKKYLSVIEWGNNDSYGSWQANVLEFETKEQAQSYIDMIYEGNHRIAGMNRDWVRYMVVEKLIENFAETITVGKNKIHNMKCSS